MLNKITDRVYYMDYVQQGDRPTLGLVVGDKSSLVIDGGNSKAHAEEFLNKIKELKIPPLKYLVLTHWHWDHVFGISTMNLINVVGESTNEKLKLMETLKWSDDEIDKRVESGEEIDFCREHIKIEHPDNDRKVEIAKADIIFKGKIRINLGGVNVTVEHIPCDHSNDCHIVNIIEEKVCFLGDLLYLDMYHGPWSYSRKKIFNLLDKLDEYDCDYYVNAHHYNYNKKEFKNFINYHKTIGNLVGEYTDYSKILIAFKEEYKRETLEKEITDINAYIEGNKKKR